MADKFRQPYLIQKELDRLKDLIQDNRRLVSQYPEELALKLNLISLENRESDVLNELNELNKRLGADHSYIAKNPQEDISPVIEYKLSGESVSLSNAPAQLLGKILLNMQNLIYSIAGSSDKIIHFGGKRPKRMESLYSLNVRLIEGSVAMEFVPALLAPTFEDRTEQTPVFYKASKFISLLPHRDIEYDILKLEIEKQIIDPRSRITTLNCLKQLIPPPGKEAKIRFMNINGYSSEIELHDDLFKRRVDQLLKEEMKNYEVEVFGVVTRINDDIPPSFMVKNWSGKLVKVNMPEERRQQIIEYLADRVPIKVIGAGNKKKSLEITDLDEIEPNTDIVIESIQDMILKAPVEVKLSYERHDNESDYWVVGNEELGIYGVEDTVEKAKHAFENDLHIDYLAYKELDDVQLTDKALDLKRKLIRLFED
jgi:hypothetical protein